MVPDHTGSDDEMESAFGGNSVWDSAESDNDQVLAAPEEVPESSCSSSSGEDSDVGASQPLPDPSSPIAARRLSRWPSNALTPGAPAVNLANIQVADTLLAVLSCEMPGCEAKSEDDYCFFP